MHWSQGIRQLSFLLMRLPGLSEDKYLNALLPAKRSRLGTGEGKGKRLKRKLMRVSRAKLQTSNPSVSRELGSR